VTLDQQDWVALLICQLEQLITEFQPLLKVADVERSDRPRPQQQGVGRLSQLSIQ